MTTTKQLSSIANANMLLNVFYVRRCHWSFCFQFSDVALLNTCMTSGHALPKAAGSTIDLGAEGEKALIYERV
jgi:hypothetical protein